MVILLDISHRFSVEKIQQRCSNDQASYVLMTSNFWDLSMEFHLSSYGYYLGK